MSYTGIKDFNKQIFFVRILLDLQSGKKLTAAQLQIYNNLIKGKLTEESVRDADFTKELYAFQKK